MTNIYWSSKIGRRRGGGSRYRGEFDCSISLINMWILEDFSAPSTNKLNEELKEAAFNTKEKCTLKEKWDRLWNDVSQSLFFLRIVATSCQRHLQNKKNLFVMIIKERWWILSFIINEDVVIDNLVTIMGHIPTCMHSQTHSNAWGEMGLFQVSFIENDYSKHAKQWLSPLLFVKKFILCEDIDRYLNDSFRFLFTLNFLHKNRYWCKHFKITSDQLKGCME